MLERRQVFLCFDRVMLIVEIMDAAAGQRELFILNAVEFCLNFCLFFLSNGNFSIWSF